MKKENNSLHFLQRRSKRCDLARRAPILLVLLLLAIGITCYSSHPFTQQVFAKSVSVENLSLPIDQVRDQAIAAVKRFHQEVATWGKTHQYHDPTNGQSYPLDNSYMARGIGEDLDRELNAATTDADYRQVLTQAQDELFHLQMLEQDYKDQTSFDKAHQTDLKLLDHYQVRDSQVIVISTVEQALRLYEHGKLVRGFLITAGSPDLPAVPGLWQSLWRVTHTTFHSPYPKNSPYYYSPTKINYAIMYHDGGYFIHDSWWRDNYGPGTQFAHPDVSGNPSATRGTHGCINLPEAQAVWLYKHTSYNTRIIVY